MTCSRVREIDLAAFLADRTSPAWEHFRSHYPQCPDCAREVAHWSDLEASLRAAAPRPLHPLPETLLAYATHPTGLADEERTITAAHLAACAACRSELRSYQGFEAGAEWVDVARERSTPVRAFGVRLLQALRGGGSGRLRPALAFAVLLVVLGSGVFLLGRARLDRPVESPSATIASEPRTAPETVAPAAEPAPPPIATPREKAIARRKPETATPAAPPEEPAAEPAPTPAPAAPAVVEELRIAALLPADPPRYVAPALPGVPRTAVRLDAVVRGRAGATPEVSVLAPDHVGLTTRASPTLYWSLSRSTPFRVELVLSDERFPDPLLDVALPDGARAGVHALRLAEHGVELEPDVTYRWSASIVPDPQDRSSEVVAGGAIRRVIPSAEVAARLEHAAPQERAHLQAETGYFYDALDQLSQWIELEPEASVLRRQRAALLEQVGLASAAGLEPERAPAARP